MALSLVLAKFAAVAMANDAIYETVIRQLNKIEEKFPNPVTTNALRLLESTHDSPVGITLKNTENKEDVISQIEQSGLKLKVLNEDEISKLPSRDHFDYQKYHLIVTGNL